MHYGNRPRKASIWTSPVALVVLVIVCAMLAKAVYNIHSKQVISSERLEMAQAELEKLKVRKDELDRNLRALSSEQGVEAELRTKYRAVKSGESVAVIVANDGIAKNQTASAASGSQTGADTPSSLDRRVRGLVPFIVHSLRD